MHCLNLSQYSSGLFASSTKTIQSLCRRAAVVLEQHEKLLDILKIPLLINTCVRNGYYSEAIDLSAHTALSLLERFPAVSVLIDVAAEAEQAIRIITSQLLLGASEDTDSFQNSQLPRRMGTLNEEELALAFLTSRAIYLEGVFSGIDGQRFDDMSMLSRRMFMTS